MDIQKVLEALGEQKTMIQTSFADIEAKQTSFETRVKAIESQLTPRKVSLPGVEDEKQTLSFLRAINAIQTKDWSGAGFEKEFLNRQRRGQCPPQVLLVDILFLLCMLRK